MYVRDQGRGCLEFQEWNGVCERDIIFKNMAQIFLSTGKIRTEVSRVYKLRTMSPTRIVIIQACRV